MSEEKPKRKRVEARLASRDASGRKRKELATRETVSQNRSQQVDPFEGAYGKEIIEPPHKLHMLDETMQDSDVVAKCISAFATGLGGHGYTLVAADGVVHPAEPTPEERAEEEKLAVEGGDPERLAELLDRRERWEFVQAERRFLSRRLKYFSRDGSFTRLLKRAVSARERTGDAYIELIRDADEDQRPKRLEYVPSRYVRLLPRDAEFTVAKFWERDPDTGAWESVDDFVQFRRYVMVVDSTTSSKRYFKQYGDPRVLDPLTGEYARQAEAYIYEDSPEARKMPAHKKANELIRLSIDWMTDGTPYGVPRYISALHEVAGRTEAGAKNLDVISSNGIPKMLVFVFGGEDDDDESDMDSVVDAFAEMADGDSRGDILFIPLRPAEVANPLAPNEAPKPMLHVVKLDDLQSKDALYKNYRKDAEDDVRGTFLLSALHIGRSDDYTRSTAKTAKRVVQEMVFGPEAREIEYIFNERLFPDMGIQHWALKLLAAPNADESVVGAVVQALGETWGITPKGSRQMVAQYLGIPQQTDDQPWDNLPTPLVKILAEKGLLPLPDRITALLEQQGAPTPDPGAARGDQSAIRADLQRLKGDATYRADVVGQLLELRRRLRDELDDAEDAA